MNSNDGLLELRLLLEELCCDLCRYQHSQDHDENPEEVEIHREVSVGGGKGFADIFVKPKLSRCYFVEVKFGYANDDIVASLKRKLSELPSGRFETASKVVLVLDRAGRAGCEQLLECLKNSLHPSLTLEVWDEAVFCGLVERHFGVTIARIAPELLIDVRTAVDHAKGEYAFGSEAGSAYAHDPLKAQLLAMWRRRSPRPRCWRPWAGSVSQEWQKQIDRLQPEAGIHAGMALGDLHVLPLRPFSRTHCGFIGDSINIAARLMNEGGEDEIVVTNGFHQQLPESSRRKFTFLEPVDAKNVGRIRAWKAKVAL